MQIFDTIHQQLSIEELLARFGYRDLIEVGRTKKTWCVAHDDGDPSCHIFPDGRFHCFSCGATGDVVDFYAFLQGIEPGLDAAYALAEEFGIPLPQRDPVLEGQARERREREDEYLIEAQRFHANLEGNASTRQWWDRRGFNQEARREFLLGATDDGISATIPWWGARGRIQGIVHRRLDGAEPKYQNPKLEEFAGRVRPLFVVGNPKTETVFVVEGLLDAIAAALTGARAIAIGGTTMSEPQREEFERTIAGTKQRAILLPDTDEPGLEAAQKVCRATYPHLKYCPTPYEEECKDLGEVLQHGGVQKVGETLDDARTEAQDYLFYAAAGAKEAYPDESERMDFIIEELMPLVVRAANGAKQKMLVRTIAREAAVTQELLKDALKEEQEKHASAAAQKRLQDEAARKQREHEEYRARVAARQDEIDELFSPGVLDRAAESAAKMHGFVGAKSDFDVLKATILLIAGSQLDLLSNGKPIAPSALVTGPPGRGKNYAADTAAEVYPEDFIYPFESSSAKSFYYLAANDPDFFRHRFVYPNEIEAVEELIEFFRPLLSSGRAEHSTVVKVGDMLTAVRYTVNGPVALAIPTVRNKTDDQLLSRLLVLELTDYPGRNRQHSEAVSSLLRPDYAAADFSDEKFLWHAGMVQNAEVRRVTVPINHPDFSIDNDELDSAARIWTNLLGLTIAHAWLEQKNRKIITLGGKPTVVMQPQDYEVALGLFEAVAGRTVINLSDMHRKILGAAYQLDQDPKTKNPNGYSQLKISEKARVSQSSVSINLTYLRKSAKLLDDRTQRIKLAHGVEPSTWDKGKVMAGFPTPELAREHWFEPEGDGSGDDPDDNGPSGGSGGAPTPAPPPASSGPQDTIDSIDCDAPNGHNLDKTAVSDHRHTVDNPSIVIDEDKPPEGITPVAVGATDSYRLAIDTSSIGESPIDKPGITDSGQAIDSIDDKQQAESPPASKAFITSWEGVEDAARAIKHAEWVSLDLEGDLDLRKAKEGIRVLTLHSTSETYLIDCWAADPSPVLEAIAGKPLYVHDASTDLAMLLKAYGFEPPEDIRDTLHASRMAYAGAWEYGEDDLPVQISNALKDALRRELGIELGDKKEYQQPKAWAEELTDEHAQYAVGDVEHLPRLYSRLMEILEEQGQLELYRSLELSVKSIVLKMIDRGMPVDVGLWNDTIEQTRRNAERLEQEALELAPDHPRGLEWKLHANYSPHTKPENRRDGRLAFELKGYVVKDMKVPTLTELAAETGDEFVTKLLIYRQERNTLNRLQKWPANHIHRGRVHARLNPYGTETGRITTTEPNLQGLDRKRPEWRMAIRASEGKKLLTADLNQIELRILANVSGDEALKAIYTDGRDLHMTTAEQAVGHPVAKDSPERGMAKTVNFALAYGGTARTIRQRLLKEGVIKPIEEIEQFVRGFFETFPGVESWQEKFGDRDPDQEDAFVTYSLLGRRRVVGVARGGYWKGYPNREERLNGPIQSTGSDILKMILKRLSREEQEHPHARLLLPAHDEVVFEVDEGYEDDAASWVKGVMQGAVEEVLGPELGGTGCVEVKLGKSWGGN